MFEAFLPPDIINTEGNDEVYEPLLPADVVNDIGTRVNTEPNEKEKKSNMMVRPSINTQINNNKKTQAEALARAFNLIEECEKLEEQDEL